MTGREPLKAGAIELDPKALEAGAKMFRNKRMCGGCPFRVKMSRKERIELAAIPPEGFPCHEESAYTDSDIQCRGHWEVRKRFTI